MAQPSIPEVREIGASPEIAAIYQAIRTASGIPQVNLIWRHLATEPTVLRWAWTLLAPVLRSQQLTEEAASILRQATPSDNVVMWEGLPAPEAARLRKVLAFYNRGNSQNMLALTALHSFARGEAPAHSPGKPAASVSGVAAVPELPPLPRRADLDPKVLAVVDRLASYHGGSGIGVTPSMYLHLALWPSALSAAEAALTPVLASEAFRSRSRSVIDSANEKASELIALMNVETDRPDRKLLDPMMRTLDNFITNTIPEMIVVGALLAAGDRD